MRKITILLSFLLAAQLAAQSGVAVAIRSGSSDPGTCSTGGRNVFFNRTTGLLKLCTAANTWSAVGGGGGSGDVVGPASATDNYVPRFDGATGKLLQSSLVRIVDNGSIALPVGAEISSESFVGLILDTVANTGPEFYDGVNERGIKWNLTLLDGLNTMTRTVVPVSGTEVLRDYAQTLTNKTLTMPGLTATLFAALGAPANGSFTYCSDCTKATPCASGGTGAFAKRINSAWDCD